MPTNIRGKEYWGVSERIQLLDEKVNGLYSIETQKIEDNEKFVEIKAVLTIFSKEVETVYHGHAREYYNQGNINKLSALENAETSAIGRSLAAANLSGSGEYASANEMQNKDQPTKNKPQQQQPIKSALHVDRLKRIVGRYDPKVVETTLIGMRGDDTLTPRKQEGLMTHYLPESKGMVPPTTIGQAFQMVKDEGWKPFKVTALDWTPKQVEDFVTLLEMP